MTVRIYVRASTKDQDATRALADLVTFSTRYDDNHVEYVEHFSGTKLDRPALAQLLKDAEQGDILLVESVDRLSRLSQDDFAILKQRIKHNRIIELNSQNNMTKEEVAKAVGVGVATVYRVLKQS